MEMENKKIKSAKIAARTFRTAGFGVEVTLAYCENPAFRVESVGIAFGTGINSKTGNRELNSLFGTLESWLNGGIAVLPLENLGLEKLSSFEMKILCELRKRVSRGETVSYGELAKLAGFPGAARAVGTVMSKNPFPLFFPCHRVIKSGGAIGFFQGGPAGAGLKKALLDAEKMNIQWRSGE